MKIFEPITVELDTVNITVICPECGNKQFCRLSDLRKIRLGTANAWTGTGGMPMIKCKSCEATGKTTLISLNEQHINTIGTIVQKAIAQQSEISYESAENAQICVSK